VRLCPLCSCQASAEHFQQCAEFALLRNRGLGPLAVTVLAIPLTNVASAGTPGQSHVFWSAITA